MAAVPSIRIHDSNGATVRSGGRYILCAGGPSFYLHFGHISAHEAFYRIARREKWKPEKLALRAKGSRAR